MAGQTVRLIGQSQRKKKCVNCEIYFGKDPRDSWDYFLNRRKCCSSKCQGEHRTTVAEQSRLPMRQMFEKWFVKSNGCWDWNGAKDKDGYGVFVYAVKTYRAPRIALELDGRPASKGQYACHTCDNPSCVNPLHLYPGTPSQNSLDAKTRDRHMRGSRSPHAKLSRDDVLEIRKSSKDVNTLAKKFNVTRSSIANVITFRTWKHIKEIS